MVSVIIPARNEIYLEKTIRNVLENAEGEIEILAMLDGWLPEPRIDIGDARVTFYHYPQSIGQRKCINEAAAKAKGKYIMKLDAHCAVDKGFDVKLAAECEPSWTVVPRMYNLDIETWQPKLHKRTDYMYITSPTDEKPFRAMYYTGKDYLRWHKKTELIDDTMCCMGPGWFMHKQRYWDLEGMDNKHGGWGQMGVELSLKAWLSGGSLKVNKNTWFAHWFRGDVGFPYQISGNDQERARRYSQDLWLNDKWPKATRKLQWVIDKFNPPNWVNDLTVLYYTANVISDKISAPVIRSLKRHGFPIVSISQQPMELGKNIVVPKGRSLQKIYEQVLEGAKKATTKYVALCEDDCLYISKHFDYRPKDKPFAYNLNRWLLHLDDEIYTYRKRPILSQCVAEREKLIQVLEERMKLPNIPDEYCGELGIFDGKLGVTDYGYETFTTDEPNLVICHSKNTSGKKYWGKDATPRKELPNWGKAEYWARRMIPRKFGRGTKARKQHSYIASIIFDMKELVEDLLEYRDRRRPIERAIMRTETMQPFIKKVLNNEQVDFEHDPYYEYLKSCDNGHTKCIKLMNELVSLIKDIKANGVSNPVDMWRDEQDNLVIHRGWRRILIMNELGYPKVACRLFKSRDAFIKFAPSKDVVVDNSIHGIARKQFVKLHEKATDKYWVHSYTILYDKYIGYLRPTAKKILEIGVFRGASLLLWQEAFTKAQIYGVDKNTAIWQNFLKGQKRIKVFVGRQEDDKFMKTTVIPNGTFDVIIDDALHHPHETLKTFNSLWASVNSGGWYIVEDLYGHYKWGEKDRVMLKKLKDMIDDMHKTGEVKELHFHYNICFIKKA